MTIATTARTLQALNGNDGRVIALDSYLLLDDGACIAVYDAEEAGKLAEVWAAYAARGVEDAYGFGCSACSPTQDADLPTEVAESLRNILGLEDDEKINRGW